MERKVKTRISPFAMREGEIKIFDGKDGYVSMNQIMQKINWGTINDVHFKILELINEFEFLTSREIFQLLQIAGIEIKDQTKVNKKLEQLIKNKIITRYYFKSPTGESDYRVYCLEKMGKYILNSREIISNWRPTDVAKPIEMIKKKLAGNQLVIAYIQKVKTMKEYKLKPEVLAKEASKKFKPTVAIKFEYENKIFNFVYEAVRREEGWKESLVKRMKLWQDFYKNFAKGDSGFETIPQLVFICEDKKHMAETFKEIVMNRVDIPKMKLYFTTDLAQIEDKLERSLYTFVEKEGKYKESNVDAKILG